ncbi:MAG: ABC transporter permease subunit, partial [Burkholderiaceae bacterium]
MKYWIGCILVVLALAGLSLSNMNEYLFFAGFVILQGVVLASAWNILGGYAGYVNFGVPAFVGVGAYTALVLHLAIDAPLLVQIAGGMVTAGLLGLFVGLLTLRLRGIFF